MTHLSDEFLLAYIDGQLERGQAAGVTELAASNAEVSRRVARLRRTQAQLLETFGAFAKENIAPPAAVLVQDNPSNGKTHAPNDRSNYDQRSSAVPYQQTNRRLWFVAAVFVSGLLGGYGATLFLEPSSSRLITKSEDRPISTKPSPATATAAWTTDLGHFHAFFPKETLTPHPDAISNIELIRFQLTKITPKLVTPPDFGRQGYSLFRGQVFSYNQDRMMQLTYAAKTDAPLTLYLIPAGSSPDAPLMFHTQGVNKAVSWVSDRIRFFLTADKDEENLKVLAVLAQSQMPKRTY